MLFLLFLNASDLLAHSAWQVNTQTLISIRFAFVLFYVNIRCLFHLPLCFYVDTGNLVDNCIPFSPVDNCIPFSPVDNGIPFSPVDNDIPFSPVDNCIPFSPVDNCIPFSPVDNCIPFSPVDNYTVQSSG